MGSCNSFMCKHDRERKDAKIERQRMVLEKAKDYMNEQPPNEYTANVLAMIHGVLDSDEYVP